MSNILVNLDKGRLISAKLADFNLSEQGDSPRITRGSMGYIAPEVLESQSQCRTLDWFSYGVVLYLLRFRWLPFAGVTLDEQYTSMVQKPVQLNTSRCNPNRHMNDLLNKLLRFDPQQRLGHSGPGSVKDHPYFDFVDWDNVRKPEEPKWTDAPISKTLKLADLPQLTTPAPFWNVAGIDCDFS
ncbi:rim15, signal transduction response regulator [Dinochytrium kinnereticum]|nr:rim15, signal transduction response regulator [Dinochytrium kinnereticum]